MRNVVLALVAALCVCSCAPKVGSPEWCEKMETKDKGDWTLNDAKDYAKHCVFK